MVHIIVTLEDMKYDLTMHTSARQYCFRGVHREMQIHKKQQRGTTSEDIQATKTKTFSPRKYSVFIHRSSFMIPDRIVWASRNYFSD